MIRQKNYHPFKTQASFITTYVIAWAVVGLLAVVILLTAQAQRPTVACIDGSYVLKQSQCPDCSTNEHCGMDKICREGSCIAKPCKNRDDCDGRFSECIYNACKTSKFEKQFSN
jgi:hypothetical protein